MAARAPQLAAGLRGAPLAGLYPALEWERLFCKLGELQRRDYDWAATVPAIIDPMMLVFADADTVRLDHILDYTFASAAADAMRAPTAR